MTEVSSALTQAVQPAPLTSRSGGDTLMLRGLAATVNIESSFSRTSRLTSGGVSGGGGSGALLRMKPGTGERLSARPQPASSNAAPTVNAQ